ncbi:hypothetical protein IB256_27480 [Pseudomonas sp. PDM17]|uniref:hypothetical protein n=1 Tax=Pseudomonas sp. PDM17 TaxID=2769285 RepID=UPI001785A982|nr:hypothetical protein [Pseudomonas sp. PDM17]MBD9504551.1 hypothetical protein [Pseudomonas sp. PDM17]
MSRKIAAMIGLGVVVVLLAVANLFLREWPLPKNAEYSLRTRVMVAAPGLEGEYADNLETISFGHGSFRYSSTWMANGQIERLSVEGNVLPLWRNYGYMTINKREATGGLVDLLKSLRIPLALQRQLELSVGSSSYVKLLGGAGSGMCFYHYDSNNLFCFELR